LELGRNTLTPVLNRDDPMKEWESRRQGGGKRQHYPELEYLQQQAELANSSGLGGWPSTGQNTSSRYPPMTHDPIGGKQGASGLREVSMSASRAPRYDHPASASISSPPQAYSNNASSNRYSTQAYQQSPVGPYEGYEARHDAMASLYAPLQPQGGPNNPVSPTTGANSSFYGSAVVSAGQAAGPNQQRNPYSGPGTNGDGTGQGQSGKRLNGMDVWPR